MTPTATVRALSLTVNLPSEGYSEYYSTHIGFVGTNLISAQSPVFNFLGTLNVVLPDTLQILDIIFSNLHGIWQVWQSIIGVYPFLIPVEWFKIMICASKLSHSSAAF